MSIKFSKRAARNIAFALASIVSVFASPLTLLASPSLRVGNQNQSESRKNRDSDSGRGGQAPSFTRPRRVEAAPAPAQNEPASSSDGPLIRVALVTDVESVSLSSSGGILIRRDEDDEESTKTIDSGSLRVEISHPETHSQRDAKTTSFSVCVKRYSDARKARKLADDLKRRYSDEVSTSLDEREKEYSVLIGRFSTRAEARKLADRLRVSGFDDPQIVALNERENRNAEARRAGSSGSSSKSATRKLAVVSDKLKLTSQSQFVMMPIKVQRRRNSSPESALKNDASDKRKLASTPVRPMPTDEATTPASIRVEGKEYRGEICLILNSRGRINVVNALPLEEYLRGVVPMELSPGQFPEIEALKAQAIAARSYALTKMGQHRDEGFDLVDDTRAQVYGGLSAEREMSSRAVEETRGVVAAFRNDEGALVPIEALYTANCGGRTENNEEVFGGTPIPYLRGVACSPDDPTEAAREIVSKRVVEALTGADGRSISREIALLSLADFSLPRHISSQFLRSPVDDAEARSWLEQLARLNQRQSTRAVLASTRSIDFLRAVAAARYGEGRTRTLLAPADIDYLLTGLPVRELPRDARADVAMLLRDGIVELPANGMEWRSTMTRGQALEIVAHALQSQSRGEKTFASNQAAVEFKTELAAGARQGRLILGSGSTIAVKSTARTGGSKFQTVNTTASRSVPRREETDSAQPGNASSQSNKFAVPESEGAIEGIAVAEDAWLFRRFGDLTYCVSRLALIGGERVIYHQNKSGVIDFIEASASDRGAASDRFTNTSQWQERVTAEQLRQRLAAARINVGRIDKVEPASFSSSNRVTEVQITGDKGKAKITRPQIRSVLGVKEYLFVVDREIDSDGQVVAFVFNGRGWGHGVGLCQIGAYGLAKEGYSYAAILQKYYTGIRLQKMY